MIQVGRADDLPLENGSVNLVVTSPPYFGLRDYGVTDGEIGQERTPSEYIESLMLVMDEMWRVTTNDASVFVVIGDKYARTGGIDRKVRGGNGDPGGRVHARLPQKGIPGVRDGSLAGMPWRFAIAAIDRGWIWRQEIIWHKPNPLPESVKNRCARSHEAILHFSKLSKYFSSQEVLGHDVWDFPVGTYRDRLGIRHPAVFPEALVQKIIIGWSKPGDTVLDPFAGTGTTCAVAAKMNRRPLGFDIKPSFVEIAQRRLLDVISNGES